MGVAFGVVVLLLLFAVGERIVCRIDRSDGKDC